MEAVWTTDGKLMAAFFRTDHCVTLYDCVLDKELAVMEMPVDEVRSVAWDASCARLVWQGMRWNGAVGVAICGVVDFIAHCRQGPGQMLVQ